MTRTLGLAAMAISAVLAGALEARAQNLDAGKTPAQMFAGTCSGCHRGSRGLLKTVSPGALPGFLREHYTTSPAAAAALAAFVAAGGAGVQAAAVPRRTDGGPEEQAPPQNRRQKQAAATPDGQPEPAPAARGGRNQPRQTPPGLVPGGEQAEASGANAEPASKAGVKGRPTNAREAAKDARAKGRLAKADPVAALPAPPEPAPVVLLPPKPLIDIGAKPGEQPPPEGQPRQEFVRSEPASGAAESAAPTPVPSAAEQPKAEPATTETVPAHNAPAPTGNANIELTKPQPIMRPETKAEPAPKAPASTSGESKAGASRSAESKAASDQSKPGSTPAPPISY